MIEVNTQFYSRDDIRNLMVALAQANACGKPPRPDYRAGFVDALNALAIALGVPPVVEKKELPPLVVADGMFWPPLEGS